MATISFDFSPPYLSQHDALPAAKAETIWIASFEPLVRYERRAVLPSIAITPAGALSTPRPRPRSKAGRRGRRAWRRYRRDDHATACRSHRAETAAEVRLPLAKPRYVGERLRPRKNRQKNQEQHFRQRIIHLAGLTMMIVTSGCGDSKLSTAGTASRWAFTKWIERLMRSRGGQRHDKRLFSVGKLIAIAFNATQIVGRWVYSRRSAATQLSRF